MTHQIGIDQSNASRLVAPAVAAGVLAKVRSLEDGRAATLALADHGEANLAPAWACQDDAVRCLVQGWCPADQARLAAHLRALAAGTPPPDR